MSKHLQRTCHNPTRGRVFPPGGRVAGTRTLAVPQEGQLTQNGPSRSMHLRHNSDQQIRFISTKKVQSIPIKTNQSLVLEPQNQAITDWDSGIQSALISI